MGITVTGCRPCFGDNILKLTVVMDAQLCEYNESQWIVHFKYVNCMFCEFYLFKNERMSSLLIHGHEKDNKGIL